MSISTQPLALTEEEIRQALDQWCRAGFFRVRHLAKRISVKEVISHSCYTLRLKTQYESRRVGREPQRGHEQVQ